MRRCQMGMQWCLKSHEKTSSRFLMFHAAGAYAAVPEGHCLKSSEHPPIAFRFFRPLWRMQRRQRVRRCLKSYEKTSSCFLIFHAPQGHAAVQEGYATVPGGMRRCQRAMRWCQGDMQWCPRACPMLASSLKYPPKGISKNAKLLTTLHGINQHFSEGHWLLVFWQDPAVQIYQMCYVIRFCVF